MGAKVCMMILCSMSISVLGLVTNSMAATGSLDPISIATQLASGTAQVILAIVVVVEAVAVLAIFNMWAKQVEIHRNDDIRMREELVKKNDAEKETDRKKNELDRAVLLELVAENSKTNANLASSNIELKTAVYHFSNVIEKCKDRG